MGYFPLTQTPTKKSLQLPHGFVSGNADKMYFYKSVSEECHTATISSHFISGFFCSVMRNYIEAAYYIPCSHVELFLDDVMNADIWLNGELVERVLMA